MSILEKEVFYNTSELYRKKYQDKTYKYIEQYKTPIYKEIDEKILETVEFFNYAWSKGDTWQYVADKFYNAPRDWKYLALFNNKPTEGHIEIGDLIMLPKSIDQLKEILL